MYMGRKRKKGSVFLCMKDLGPTKVRVINGETIVYQLQREFFSFSQIMFHQKIIKRIKKEKEQSLNGRNMLYGGNRLWLFAQNFRVFII